MRLFLMWFALAGCGDKSVGDSGQTTGPPVDDDGDGFDTTTDCDDTDPAINPDATEVCDGVDNDCDGATDTEDNDVEGLADWFADKDGDGYGDPDRKSITCEQPEGMVADNTDCDDDEELANPGGTERCDGIDNDCDGLTDDDDDLIYGTPTWFFDADGDGYGVDTDTRVQCAQPDGYADRAGDCDDSTDTINPDAEEIPGDGIDNDCAGGDEIIDTGGEATDSGEASTDSGEASTDSGEASAETDAR